jgi:hypothetical protein
MVFAALPLVWSPLAEANPYSPSLCTYQLGGKTVTMFCSSDPQAEPGMAGNMPGQLPPELQDPGQIGWNQYQQWLQDTNCSTVPMC